MKFPSISCNAGSLAEHLNASFSASFFINISEYSDKLLNIFFITVKDLICFIFLKGIIVFKIVLELGEYSVVGRVSKIRGGLKYFLVLRSKGDRVYININFALTNVRSKLRPGFVKRLRVLNLW